jgi:hypothetical protein
MRRIGLSFALALIGVALIGGFLTQVIPDEYVPRSLHDLGLYVGTNGSVAGAIFGVGLLWVATNPRTHLPWVILTIAYAVLLVLYQLYVGLVLHNPWELRAIIFGVLAGALVAALYPTATRVPAMPPPSTEPTTSAPASEGGSEQ